MSEIIVAYWSGTGNTGAMAEYVAQGIREGISALRLACHLCCLFIHQQFVYGYIFNCEVSHKKKKVK